MARQYGKANPSRFFLDPDFPKRTVFVETVISCVFFVFESQQIQNKA